jgi:lipopolysaccharide biosynthesis protein
MDGPMWWNKKRKLERLCDELKSIAMRDRLARDSENDLSEDERCARALRQVRQSELLLEIERLTAKQTWRAPEDAKATASARELSGGAARQERSDEALKSRQEPGHKLEERDRRIRRDRKSPAAA